MGRNLAVWLLAGLLLVGCSGGAATLTDPIDVVNAYEQALDRGDIEACLDLLADDVVFRQDPPGIWREGKDSIRALLEDDAVWHHQTTIITPFRADGEIVSFSLLANGDDLGLIGVTDLTIYYQYVVRDGKIILIYNEPDSDDWAMALENMSGGTGIIYVAVDTGFRVEEMALNSPALETGLKTGDIIVAVDGVGLERMRKSEMELLMVGRPGSRVNLSVLRQGETAPLSIDVTLIRSDTLRYR